MCLMLILLAKANEEKAFNILKKTIKQTTPLDQQTIHSFESDITKSAREWAGLRGSNDAMLLTHSK